MSKPGRNDACPCGSGKKYKQCCMHASPVAATQAPLQPIPLLFQHALTHHQAGRLSEAEALYREILVREPAHAEALHLLGVIAYQSGNYVQARALIEAAIGADARQAAYYSNLGNVFMALGQADAAAVAYRHALLLNPNYAEAHYNLGNILLAHGEHEAAAARYMDALRVRAAYPEAHNNLGNARRAGGDLQAAIACFKAALAYRADYVDAHNNLANVYQELGHSELAVAHYRQAIAIQPRFAESYFNLGVALEARGEFDAAADQYAQALTLKPDYAAAHNNLGRWLASRGRLGDAIHAYRQALASQPDYVEAYNNWGVALQRQVLLDEAIERYRQALAIRPDYAIAHNNLGGDLASQGKLDEALHCFRRALELEPDLDAARSNLLFHLNNQAQLDPEYYLAEARRFGAIVASRVTPYSHSLTIRPGARLRIGFISGDLRAHPVGYFLESVVAHLDPARFELFAYATQIDEDALTARLRPYFSAWHTLAGFSDAEAARKIHDDTLHILIDLAGHTADNRLPVLAWRPAPVQVAWLGYFASTGLATIDYIIGDPQVLPVGEENHFVERAWRLPDCYLCFTPPQDEVEVSALPMLSRGYVTFGCFNKLNKMNDAVLALWARVLHAVPDARLLLKSKELTDVSARDLTRARFARHGIAPERIVIEGFSARAAYLADYNRVDIALDPFPYPGGTTTVEALWMGVPVLSRRGRRFLAHAGESLLQTAGLADWVAADDDDYVAKAQAFAALPQQLSLVRSGLRAQLLASPLCDAPRFAANLGDALSAMWQRYKEPAGASSTEMNHG